MTQHGHVDFQGVEATLGGGRQDDLLMITNPLGLRYQGCLEPRVEGGAGRVRSTQGLPD